MKEFAYEAFAVALDITFWVVASRGGRGWVDGWEEKGREAAEVVAVGVIVLGDRVVRHQGSRIEMLVGMFRFRHRVEIQQQVGGMLESMMISWLFVCIWSSLRIGRVVFWKIGLGYAVGRGEWGEVGLSM